MEAINAGCSGIHTTINGMGERAGNTPMASIVAAIKDFLPDYTINIDEHALYNVSILVSTYLSPGLFFLFLIKYSTFIAL